MPTPAGLIGMLEYPLDYGAGRNETSVVLFARWTAVQPFLTAPGTYINDAYQSFYAVGVPWSIRNPCNILLQPLHLNNQSTSMMNSLAKMKGLNHLHDDGPLFDAKGDVQSGFMTHELVQSMVDEGLICIQFAVDTSAISVSYFAPTVQSMFNFPATPFTLGTDQSSDLATGHFEGVVPGQTRVTLADLRMKLAHDAMANFPDYIGRIVNNICPEKKKSTATQVPVPPTPLLQKPNPRRPETIASVTFDPTKVTLILEGVESDPTSSTPPPDQNNCFVCAQIQGGYSLSGSPVPGWDAQMTVSTVELKLYCDR
jgi:hypothetical protein